MEFNFDFEGGVHFHLFSHVDGVTPFCLMLVGGFNSFKSRKQRLKKCESNWIISPCRGENQNILNHHLGWSYTGVLFVVCQRL